MPICSKCGHQNRGARFCVKCGTPLVSATPETLAKVDILQKRIAQDSLNPNLYLELGELYQQAGMLNEALVEYQKVVTLDTCHVVAHVNIGTIYLNQSHAEKAVEFFEKALQLSHGSADVKKQLFKAYHQVGNVDSIIRFGEEILSAEPENLEIRKAVTAAYKKKNSDKQVGKQIEAMLALAPNDTEVLLEAADYYAKGNQTEKATRYYSTLLEVTPNDNSIAMALGRVLCLSGDYKRCVELLSERLSSLTSSEEFLARVYVSYSLTKLGNKQQVLRHLPTLESSSTVELDSADKVIHAEVFHEMAKDQQQQENLGAVVRYLRIASTILPEDTSFKELLEEAEATLIARQAKTRKRIVRYVAASIGGMILLVTAWRLMHGGLEVVFQGAKGARLLIDGRPVNDNALVKPGVFSTSALFLGSHVITLEAEGFKAWQETVSVAFGRSTSVHATLIPVYGMAYIRSVPEQAQIYVDGKYVGKTPLTLSELTIGKYTIEGRLESYKRDATTILVRGNDTNHVYFTLSQASPAIFVGSWRNLDAATRGIIVVDIRLDGAVFSIRIWGVCSGSPCYQGEVQAQESKALDGFLETVWQESFMTSIRTFEVTGDTLVLHDSETFFDDRGKRESTYLFSRTTEPLPPARYW